MIYLIVNKNARTGKGATLLQEIQKRIMRHDIEYRVMMTLHAGHATQLAKSICDSTREGEKVKIIVLGGDGTINEVINGISDFSKVMLGVIPTGSGNDFVRGVGISKNLDVNLDRIINCEQGRLIDMGRVTVGGANKTSKYFAISCGIGLDAIVCDKVNGSKIKKVLNLMHIGKLSYLVQTVVTLFTMKTIKCDRYDEMIFCAAMILEAEGGGVPMAKGCSIDDGMLTICAAHDVGRAGAFLRLPFLAMGKHKGFKCFDVFDTETLELTLEEKTTVHIDGEILGQHKNIKIDCIPNQLEIIC